MKMLIDKLQGKQRLTLTETQRALVLLNGRFDAMLGPGEHRLSARKAEVIVFDLTTPVFTSQYADALMRTRPDLADPHVVTVETGANEIAVLNRNGRVWDLLSPDKRVLLWRDAGDWQVETLALSDTHDVPRDLVRRLGQTERGRVLMRGMSSVEVALGRVGLWSIDGVHQKVLTSGTYWFWQLGRKHLVKMVDTRWQAKEVTGQEILTKDRVTLRINLSADFRVTDPLRAVSTVGDFSEALHRALQLAFRKTLGALTLDQMLADKVSVDAEAAAKVRGEMAEIGIEVGDIALKDVILPGEMRDILNKVVATQKEAEANVIRRREETNATRSLLNTAKVMAENPVMLRLKELEALESIASKVDQLTVHNGTEGLMNGVVRLSDQT